MIKLYGIEKKLSDGFTLRIPSLEIEDGERVALIGPNGSGKSTLLRLIAGIITPDKGTIEIKNEYKNIGYQPQNAYAFAGTVYKNVCLCKNAADAGDVIEACLLGELKNKKVSALSGGERQRTCLARMLCGDYRLLLLDEPLSAADIETSAVLEKLIVKRCEEKNAGLLMATHLPSQAAAVATKILIMNGGEVSEYSGISALKNPESDFGKKFTGLWSIPDA